MTGANTDEQQQTAIEFEAPTEPVVRQVTPVRIPGPDKQEIEEYPATRPKDGFLLKLGRMASGSDEQQIALVDEFIDKVFTEDDAARLRHRIEDDDDWLDLDSDTGGASLVAVIEQLQQVWGKGRGGKSSGSPGPRRSPGKRSTARSLSKGSTRKR